MSLEPPKDYQKVGIHPHPTYGVFEIFKRERPDMRHMYIVGVLYSDNVFLSHAYLEDYSDGIAELEFTLKKLQKP